MGICFSLSSRKENNIPTSENVQNDDAWPPGSYVAARILPIDILGRGIRPAKPHL